MVDWFDRLRQMVMQPRVIVVYPDGVESRGFHGKNSFADQANLVGQSARVIFDVGAHFGETTERYLELFPSAMIYCFEPFPAAFERIVEIFSGNNHVRPYRYAISDTTGTCAFHTFTFSVTNSLFPAAPDAYDFVAPGQMDDTGIITVECTTIDEFCRREHINRIDILKLDVQGGEVKALKGTSRMLSERRIGLIYTEVNFVSVYHGQAWFWEVARFLHQHGYRLLDFYNFAYSESGQLKWGDAIFRPIGRG